MALEGRDVLLRRHELRGEPLRCYEGGIHLVGFCTGQPRAAAAQEGGRPTSFGATGGAQASVAPTLGFTPIRPDTTDEITVAPGYRSQVLLKWGDPLFPSVVVVNRPDGRPIGTGRRAPRQSFTHC